MPQITDPRSVDYRLGASAPSSDIPLWLRPAVDWWNQLSFNQPYTGAQVTEEAKRKAALYQQQQEFLARQKGLQQYEENLRQSFNPARIGEAINQVPEYLQGLGKFSGDVPMWQRALSGGAPIPEALKVMGDVGTAITSGFAETPYFGAANVKPWNQSLQEWEKGKPLAELPVPNPWNNMQNVQVPREAAGFMTPDMFIGAGFGVIGKGEKAAMTASKVAGRLSKVENPIFEVVKLLDEGVPRQTIYEAMTTKAKGARQWVTNEAQDLLRTAEEHLAQIKGTVKPPAVARAPEAAVTGQKPPVEPPPAQGPAPAGPPPEGPRPRAAPVGKGAERESEHFRKINERLQGELGDNPIYQQADLENQAARAIPLVEANIDDARKITLGYKAPPAGMLDTAIGVAYEEKMRAIGDIKGYTEAVNAMSLRATRRGQEIAALRGAVNDNSPTHFVQQVIKERVEKVGNKLPKTPGQPSSAASRVTQQIDRDVAKLTKQLKARQLDIQEAQKILDRWICK